VTDVERRLKALEEENRGLKSQIAALQLLAPTPKAPSLPPSPVRISSPPLARSVLPTEDEYQRLLTVVTGRHPILKPRADTPDYFAQFKAAFIRLSHVGRRDKVDNQRGLGFWVDDCQEFCRRHQINPSSIGGGAYTAALIAHADIKFVIEDWPHDFVCSLQWGGGGAGCRGWWKRALGGTLLSPEPPRYPVPAASPARVRR
jgi:hypothetical protein